MLVMARAAEEDGRGGIGSGGTEVGLAVDAKRRDTFTKSSAQLPGFIFQAMPDLDLSAGI